VIVTAFADTNVCQLGTTRSTSPCRPVLLRNDLQPRRFFAFPQELE
jgi:hypothetical protein